VLIELTRRQERGFGIRKEGIRKGEIGKGGCEGIILCLSLTKVPSVAL
jgi:hypothetical protein